jgi:hypothetical protein
VSQGDSEAVTEKASAETADQFQYELRLLAYLHVLGWSDLVNRSKSERAVLHELNLLSYDVDAEVSASEAERAFFAEHAPETSGHSLLDVTQFSDRVVISCPLTWPAAANLLVDVQQLCHRLLWYGHYIRGAITVGQLVHHSNVIFGPALLDAHHLERNVSKYPRIVVTPAAVPYLNDSFGTDLSNETFTHLRSLRTDQDGLQYVDILGLGAGFKNQKRQRHGDEEHLIDLVKAKLAEDIHDLGRVAKHTWMLDYLDQAVAECGPA